MDTSVATTKDFGPIRDDYTFFENHSTEAEQDLNAYVPGFRAVLEQRLRISTPTGRALPKCRVLDYGCGPGTFSAQLYDRLGCPPDRLCLSLVEPQPIYREQAMAALARFSTSRLQASSSLQTTHDQAYDLIVANHVFYYVPDLDAVLPAIVRALAPGGMFQTAIAGLENILIQFWMKAFAMLGQPVPYHTAESVAHVLERHRIPARTQEVTYRLEFPDSPNNRSRVLRFLLGEHYSLLPTQDIRRFFDPYAAAGMITIDTCQTHFAIHAC